MSRDRIASQTRPLELEGRSLFRIGPQRGPLGLECRNRSLAVGSRSRAYNIVGHYHVADEVRSFQSAGRIRLRPISEAVGPNRAFRSGGRTRLRPISEAVRILIPMKRMRRVGGTWRRFCFVEGRRRVGDAWRRLCLVEERRKVGDPWYYLLHGCEVIESHRIPATRPPRCNEGEAGGDRISLLDVLAMPAYLFGVQMSSDVVVQTGDLYCQLLAFYKFGELSLYRECY